MRWDSGRRGDFDWLVAPELPRLREKIIGHHRHARLCITSFDSGPFAQRCGDGEYGWVKVGSIAISPPLTEGVAIPSAGFDEWYLFDGLPTAAFSPEVFVNYVPFPVLPVGADATQQDGSDQWLADAQIRFWRQIEVARPISYIARASIDIVVSRCLEFVDDLRA